MVTPKTTAVTASAVLALSKAVWRLGILLSNLDQEPRIIEPAFKTLAGEVKSLGIECDLVYFKLEESVSESDIGPPPSYDVDDRVWNCLTKQVEEISQTIQELELLVQSVRRDELSFINQAQRTRNLVKNKNQAEDIRARVCRHADNLHTTLLLINFIHTHNVPARDGKHLFDDLDKLQDMVAKLQRSLEADPQLPLSRAETMLMQCAREVIVKGMTMYQVNLAGKSACKDQRGASSNIHVADWVNALESIRQDVRCLNPTADAKGNDSDDDLDTDLVKAALDTGTKAFEAHKWEEAESLLQEALRVLQQLPKQQRTFCDIFSLHYRLAVCAYHTQEPADAQEALMSIVEQSTSSDQQRGYMCNAKHLLSQLYIRIGKVDCAWTECEKALQGRRRLLGKWSDASLESMALMAHIYVLLGNRALAKSCLAMIPETRRDTILKVVEENLGATVQHLDFSSLMTQTMSGDSPRSDRAAQHRFSTSTLGLPVDNCGYGPFSTTPRTPPASLWKSQQYSPSGKTVTADVQSIMASSPALSSAECRSEQSATQKEILDEQDSTSTVALSRVETSEVSGTSKGRTLSRKEILDKIGCHPRDRIEEAVCAGDHSALASLLNRKKSFWRSSLRKRVRSERVTALHFAALFGEIDMTRRLLGSNFNINEIPFGYSTSLTPLHFAIGARQVDMVEFLIANGARPSEPDSWSTLAGQLMSRSWLLKTMSEAEREFVPDRIIAIFGILLKYGWYVNAPFETSGKTVLHQAVTFWTGAYKWDLDLRAAVTSFLCERGANPFQINKEGKTPYDMATASGHQDLMLILERHTKRKHSDNRAVEPVELPGYT